MELNSAEVGMSGDPDDEFSSALVTAVAGFGLDQLAEEQLRLINHRFDQQVVELIVRIKLGIGRGAFYQPEIEPIVEKIIDKAARALVVEKAFGLLSQDFGNVQPAAFGDLTKLSIWS